MLLTQEEKVIIERFKQVIKEKLPGQIVEVLIFGSCARGEAKASSDIDVLVITLSADWRQADVIREIGYNLDEAIDYKLSIQVMSKDHVDYLRKNNFQFINNVDRESIAV